MGISKILKSCCSRNGVAVIGLNVQIDLGIGELAEYLPRFEITVL